MIDLTSAGRRHALALACLLACLFGPGSPLTASAAPPEPMTINFVGADIDSAVKAIGQMTGRNFVIDPRVKGVINIVSGRPVTPEMAYQTLVAALRLQGFAVVEGKNVTRILPEAEARTQAGPVNASAGNGEQITTQVFLIRYESAPQLVNALKPLISTCLGKGSANFLSATRSINEQPLSTG